jgi:hypothetical protein
VLDVFEYSVGVARRFMDEYKFKNWTTHRSTGKSVTAEERLARADEVARKLCSHNRSEIGGREKDSSESPPYPSRCREDSGDVGLAIYNWLAQYLPKRSRLAGQVEVHVEREVR